MNTKHHQNFKNHPQQTILYSYIQYSGLTALTLVSNTVFHRFALPLRIALCSSDEHSLSAVRSLTRCEKNRLSNSCVYPVLYSA